MSPCLCAFHFTMYLLFLKRRVKRRKQKADRMPPESSVHTTALSTGDRERLGSSTAICKHMHKQTQSVTFKVLQASQMDNVSTVL